MDYKIFLIVGIIVVVIWGYLFVKAKNKKVNLILGILGCVLVIGCSCLLFPKIMEEINFGLDLKGGFEVLYQVSSLDGEELASDSVYNTYKALLKRIDILGVSEPEITIEGDDRIRVRLAGVTNKDEAREVLSSTASLTFRDTSDNLLMTSEALGGSAKVATDSTGKPAVSLSIKDVDTFYDVTTKVSKMMDNRIVIWLDFEEGVDSYDKEEGNCGTFADSKCLSAATVSQGFASDVIIQGNFTSKEATSLVELINSGALPTRLEEISSRTVEASFGENSLNKTLQAGILGIILVVLLMIVIYHFSGFIASMGLVLYTLLSFIVFYLIDGVLTLPGIAAMLLGIGMAVDATVIHFERMKEYLKINKSLPESFDISNESSFSSIIDSNITTLIVAVILFVFGESSVKGFATMLIINIVVTVLIMVYLNRFILKLFIKTNFFDEKINLFVGLSRKKIVGKKKEIIVPYQKIDFVKHSKKANILTIVILIFGLVLCGTKGFNLGVDFAGGTKVTVASLEVFDKVLDYFENSDYTIEKIENDQAVITIKEILSKEEIRDLTVVMQDEFGTDTDIYVVSKLVKQELTKNAIYSLVLASLGIVIYVSIRFKWNYALAGIVALIHDVVMVVLFFGVFGLEISSIFLAAILTIIGYSINDTIVTFDMIRERYTKKYKNDISKKEDLIQLVNDSMRLTIFRSVLTTITTILPVICLIVLGAWEIVNFNIALLVGFIAGVYSSIFISNSLWLWLEYRRIMKPKADKDDGDDELEELKVKGINC